MKTIKLKLQNTSTIEAISHQSFEEHDINNDLKIYSLIFDDLVSLLNVDYPDLALWGTRFIPQRDMRISSAISITPEDDKNIDHNLLLVGNIEDNLIYLTGVIAHEMRHFWQKRHYLKKFFNESNDYGSSTNFMEDAAEIDADAFGFIYMAKKFNISIEEAAEILCPYEKTNNNSAYQKRINLAHKLLDEFKPRQKLRNKILRKLGIR